MDKNTAKTGVQTRPPIVGIFGHVDHGKSTLLDFIRKSNIVGGEAGGITQHIGAYQAIHKTDSGEEKVITFIDTPGHAAFTEMRSRGAKVADIAILVVAADDGVKAQTLEALESVKAAGIPFIVAINKIDKPGANIDMAKQSLAENQVYVEGYGGNISAVPVSAKDGTGIDELLEMILLTAELEELKGDSSLPARGLVIESHKDPKKGIYATVIIQDGRMERGDCIIVNGKVANIRTMIDYTGSQVDEATLSQPIEITGFSEIPPVGSQFTSCGDKKEAETIAKEQGEKIKKQEKISEANKEIMIPLVIKADTAGTLEAIEKELRKLETDQIALDIIASGVGNVSESDLRLISKENKPQIIAFGVKVDSTAKDLAENMEVPINTYDIIYRISEDLEKEIASRIDAASVGKPTGILSVIKVFNGNAKKQVVGGEVTEGSIGKGNKVEIRRKLDEVNDKGEAYEIVGKGKISLIQHKRDEVSQIEAGKQCGLEIETRTEISEKDEVLAYS